MCNFFDCLLYILKTFHFSLGCSLNLNLEPFNNFVEKYGGRGGVKKIFVIVPVWNCHYRQIYQQYALISR